MYHKKLTKYATCIAKAEAALGPLTFAQKSDLLLDHFSEIEGWKESHKIVSEIENIRAFNQKL